MADKTDTARMENAEPEKLAVLLSEILDPQQGKAFFNPYQARLSAPGRRRAYTALVTQLGPRYARCSLENYELYDTGSVAEDRPSQAEVLDQIRPFARDMPARLRSGGGVVLFGRPGTGKDHLLAALAFSAVLQYGWEVRWVDGLTLFQNARTLIRKDGDERAFLRQYQEPPILVLSDPLPQKGDASPYATDLIRRILDRRYRDLKSTWCSLNVLCGEEAEDRLAGSIVDRLRDNSLCLECNWPSHRTRRSSATDGGNTQ